MISTEPKKELQRKITELRALPAPPAILQPLSQMLRQPPDKIELKKVVQLVQMEKTITGAVFAGGEAALRARASGGKRGGSGDDAGNSADGRHPADQLLQSAPATE